MRTGIALFAARLALALIAAGLLTAALPGVASAVTLHVCPRGCRFQRLAPAISAARSGDTIKIAPGTYKGGVTIDKSLKLIGAGAGKTTVKGGGPVITIGRFLALHEPTVTISGITITGGLTTKGPEYPSVAAGGGIYIPARHKYARGATVTVLNSVVSGNEASPAIAKSVGPPCPHTAHCPFAGAFGGGIENEGKLTLIRTTVSHNKAVGPRASDADGGGIDSGYGSALTLRDVTVTHNLARASQPNGRFAEGGGVFASDKTQLVITHSTLSANTASLSSSFAYFLSGGKTLELGAHSGGLQTGNKGSVSIFDTKIENNTVTATDLNGQPEVFDSGFCNCGTSKLTMRDSSVIDNHLSATVKTLQNVFADTGAAAGGALETDGPANIEHAVVSGNTVQVKSPHGAAIASGIVFSGADPSSPALISDSLVRGNTVIAWSGSGSERILGAGVVNIAGLTLRHDHITGNRAVLRGRPGLAQGGGVWNGHFPTGPTPVLRIDDTTVTHNILAGVSGSKFQGGGLFTSLSVMLSGDTIRHNRPNNCFGTGC